MFKNEDNVIKSPCIGVTPNALPEVQTPNEEENSQTEVSTRNALLSKTIKSLVNEDTPHWYVLRCTYGREKKAYEHLCLNSIKAFYPTINNPLSVDGKPGKITESRLPNILFAFGSFEQLKGFVYDNYHEQTKHLRFYYNLHHDGKKRTFDSSSKTNDFSHENMRCRCC